MAGTPDMPEIVECMPKPPTIAFDASELMTDMVDPRTRRISTGGGAKKTRNANGNSSCCIVCGLNKVSTSPAVNIGSVNI